MMDKPRTTLSGRPPNPDCADAGAPDVIDPNTGMHKDYWVLPEEERKKGFVRPYRTTYRHVGERPRFALRPLTEEEQAQHAGCNYVAYEEYPESERPLVGMYWTDARLKTGCGSDTTMGRALSETYARDPSYYGSTFCCNCGKHFPVREFIWTGTTERVGS